MVPLFRRNELPPSSGQDTPWPKWFPLNSSCPYIRLYGVTCYILEYSVIRKVLHASQMASLCDTVSLAFLSFIGRFFIHYDWWRHYNSGHLIITLSSAQPKYVICDRAKVKHLYKIYQSTLTAAVLWLALSFHHLLDILDCQTIRLPDSHRDVCVIP